MNINQRNWLLVSIIIAAAATALLWSCAVTELGAQRRVENYVLAVGELAVSKGDLTVEEVWAAADALRDAADVVQAGMFQPGQSMELGEMIKGDLDEYIGLLIDIAITEADVYLIEHPPEVGEEELAKWAGILRVIADALYRVD